MQTPEGPHSVGRAAGAAPEQKQKALVGSTADATAATGAPGERSVALALRVAPNGTDSVQSMAAEMTTGSLPASVRSGQQPLTSPRGHDFAADLAAQRAAGFPVASTVPTRAGWYQPMPNTLDTWRLYTSLSPLPTTVTCMGCMVELSAEPAWVVIVNSRGEAWCRPDAVCVAHASVTVGQAWSGLWR